MKYALVNGEVNEAEPGLKGTCSGCGGSVIAKCGNIKIKHWSHHKIQDCDSWWENETEWHRDWKNQFPKEFQEVLHRSANGEFHRADVKTDKNRIIEFQYSAISSNEQQSRNEFYGKIVWVVNGLRRKRDSDQFFSAIKVVGGLDNQLVRRVCDVITDNKSALLRDWSNDSVPVIFDFLEQQVLWCLLPRKPEFQSVVLELSRQEFIRMNQPSVNFSEDIFSDFLDYCSTTNSAVDLLQKDRQLKKDQARIEKIQAEEAYLRNPNINRRGFHRL